LISLVVAGVLPTPVMVFTVSEVVVIPFLLYWHSTLADPTAGATDAAAGAA
jgi:hypothetical protein